MTLQEAKEQVAKSRDLEGWPDYDKIPYKKWFMIESMLNEAAELYARSKWEQACEDQRKICAKSSSSSGDIGFGGLLTILFIGLKLTGYINWSWWWVLSPLWISFSLAIIVFIVVVMIAVFSK